jgi:hypothetical protein
LKITGANWACHFLNLKCPPVRRQGDQTLLYSESAWESTEKESLHSKNPRAHLGIEERIGGDKKRVVRITPFLGKEYGINPIPTIAGREVSWEIIKPKWPVQHFGIAERPALRSRQK